MVFVDMKLIGIKLFEMNVKRFVAIAFMMVVIDSRPESKLLGILS